jgi:hypothetical protein
MAEFGAANMQVRFEALALHRLDLVKDVGNTGFSSLERVLVGRLKLTDVMTCLLSVTLQEALSPELHGSVFDIFGNGVVLVLECGNLIHSLGLSDSTILCFIGLGNSNGRSLFGRCIRRNHGFFGQGILGGYNY